MLRIIRFIVWFIYPDRTVPICFFFSRGIFENFCYGHFFKTVVRELRRQIDERKISLLFFIVNEKGEEGIQLTLRAIKNSTSSRRFISLFPFFYQSSTFSFTFFQSTREIFLPLFDMWRFHRKGSFRCTPNACQHNGTIAIGSKQIECICQAPWDGRNCERLACWRMAPKGLSIRSFRVHSQTVTASFLRGLFDLCPAHSE